DFRNGLVLLLPKKSRTLHVQQVPVKVAIVHSLRKSISSVVQLHFIIVNISCFQKSMKKNVHGVSFSIGSGRVVRFRKLKAELTPFIDVCFKRIGIPAHSPGAHPLSDLSPGGLLKMSCGIWYRVSRI